jgi:hypothetical protein
MGDLSPITVTRTRSKPHFLSFKDERHGKFGATGCDKFCCLPLRSHKRYGGDKTFGQQGSFLVLTNIVSDLFFRQFRRQSYGPRRWTHQAANCCPVAVPASTRRRGWMRIRASPPQSVTGEAFVGSEGPIKPAGGEKGQPSGQVD